MCELTMKLFRSFIVSMGGFLGRIEIPDVNFLVSNYYLHAPASPLLPADALESAFIVFMGTEIALILAVSRPAKIASSIVKSVVVTVVGSFSPWRKNNVMHENKTGIVPRLSSYGVKALSVLGKSSAPFEFGNTFKNICVNYSHLVLSKRDKAVGFIGRLYNFRSDNRRSHWSSRKGLIQPSF